MINPRTLERQFRNKNHKQQLTALINNGLSIPGTIYNKLLEQPASINALALRRLCQLTYYRPDPAIPLLLDEIINKTSKVPYTQKPLAAACVISAIHAIEQYFPQMITPAHQQIVEDNLQTIATYFKSASPQAGSTTQDQKATTAFIFYLLAADASFRNTVDLKSHVKSYQQNKTQYDPQTQTLYKHAMLDIAA